jgi:hypothetical protein
LILRRLVKKVVLYVVLPAGLLAGGYGCWAKSRLDARLEADGVQKYSGSYSLVPPQEVKVETSLPRVLRVEVKRRDGQNWLPSASGDLIHGAYAWDPSKNQWLDLPPSSDALVKSAKLRVLQPYPVPKLIDVLADEDPLARQVAITELRLRTGQDLGYRHDLTPEKRAAAIAKWRSWWEENKVRYGVEKVLDAVEGAVK